MVSTAVQPVRVAALRVTTQERDESTALCPAIPSETLGSSFRVQGLALGASN